MIAALSINRPVLGAGGTYPVPGSYGVSIGGERLYDAWGGVRAGQSHGYPNHRYCANLGHISDDETSLTYMRARYYEPSTGRFISEDPARDGWNWDRYSENNPIANVDFNGKEAELASERLTRFRQLLKSATFLSGLSFFVSIFNSIERGDSVQKSVAAATIDAVTAYVTVKTLSLIANMVNAVAQVSRAKGPFAGFVVGFYASYAIMCLLAIEVGIWWSANNEVENW